MQAQQTSQPASKKVLHVGCGQASKEKMHPAFHGPEWQEVRLDIDKAVNPDIIGDIREMPDVANETMDGLFSSHNLEHVYAYEVPKVLGEFFRVIKKGGIAIITLPDIQSVAFAVAKGELEKPLYQSPAGPITPLDIFYGHNSSLVQGKHYMAHKTAFTAHTLGEKMLGAGFHNVKVARDTKGHNLWAQGFKPETQSGRAYKHHAQIDGRYDQAVVKLTTEEVKLDELDAKPQLDW